MKFKESPYYNEEFSGKYLYEKIEDDDEILTIQEYFNINESENEYHKQTKNIECSLKVFDDYYEFNFQRDKDNLFLVFDKPVYIIGKHCRNIIAPEIVIKSKENKKILYCFANKLIVDNCYYHFYEIYSSKIKNIYFYNKRVSFHYSQINIFFIFNNELIIDGFSSFVNYPKIKCFGRCDNLKSNILKDERFKKGIIHIE